MDVDMLNDGSSYQSSCSAKANSGQKKNRISSKQRPFRLSGTSPLHHTFSLDNNNLHSSNGTQWNETVSVYLIDKLLDTVKNLVKKIASVRSRNDNDVIFEWKIDNPEDGSVITVQIPKKRNVGGNQKQTNHPKAAEGVALNPQGNESTPKKLKSETKSKIVELKQCFIKLHRLPEISTLPVQCKEFENYINEMGSKRKALKLHKRADFLGKPITEEGTSKLNSSTSSELQKTDNMQQICFVSNSRTQTFLEQALLGYRKFPTNETRSYAPQSMENKFEFPCKCSLLSVNGYSSTFPLKPCLGLNIADSEQWSKRNRNCDVIENCVLGVTCDVDASLKTNDVITYKDHDIAEAEETQDVIDLSKRSTDEFQSFADSLVETDKVLANNMRSLSKKNLHEHALEPLDNAKIEQMPQLEPEIGLQCTMPMLEPEIIIDDCSSENLDQDSFSIDLRTRNVLGNPFINHCDQMQSTQQQILPALNSDFTQIGTNGFHDDMHMFVSAEESLDHECYEETPLEGLTSDEQYNNFDGFANCTESNGNQSGHVIIHQTRCMVKDSQFVPIAHSQIESESLAAVSDKNHSQIVNEEDLSLMWNSNICKDNSEILANDWEDLGSARINDTSKYVNENGESAVDMSNFPVVDDENSQEDLGDHINLSFKKLMKSVCDRNVIALSPVSNLNANSNLKCNNPANLNYQNILSIADSFVQSENSSLNDDQSIDETNMKRNVPARSLYEKPFVCPKCNKKFKRKDHLKNHIIIHNGVRNFSCTMCQSKFFFSYQLKRHALAVHKKKI